MNYIKNGNLSSSTSNKFELTQFHTDEYIDFIDRVTPDNLHLFEREQVIFNVGDDCPVFDGLENFVKFLWGSMEGAARLNRGQADIAINYAGGLHHAKNLKLVDFVILMILYWGL